MALSAMLLCAIAACSGLEERSAYKNVGPDGWLYDMPLDFAPAYDPMPADSVTTGDIAIVVRHTNGYEYSNIWVELQHHDGAGLRTDTFNIALADPLGRWYGTGIGVGYQRVDTVLRNARLDLRHPMSLRHIMRTDTLPGIEQIGLIFR